MWDGYENVSKHVFLGRSTTIYLVKIIINNKNTRDLFEPVDNINGAWKLTRAAEIFVDEQLPIEVNKWK